MSRAKWIWPLILTLASLATTSSAINSIPEGYQINNGQSIEIDAHGVCSGIANASGRSHFIATKTPVEWASFLAHVPTGLTLSACVPSGGACTGTEVGGGCWYLGADAQSCMDVCAAAGVPYNTMTETYAGSGGTIENCAEVLDALGVDSSDIADMDDPAGPGLGCFAVDGVHLGAPGGMIPARDNLPTTDPDATDIDGLPAQRACACGGGSVIPDPTPNAIDWANFTNISSSQRLTGINMAINVRIDVADLSGSPSVEYRLNSGAWNTIISGFAADISVTNQRIQFRVNGTIGDSAQITLTNLSDGNALIDTVTGTVGPDQCYQATPPPAGTECLDGTIFLGDANGARYMMAACAFGNCTSEPQVLWWGSRGHESDVLEITNVAAATDTDPNRGEANTAAMLGDSSIYFDSPAHACEALTEGGYSDWFLPNLNEVATLVGPVAVDQNPSAYMIWSSSERTSFDVWTYNLSTNAVDSMNKMYAQGYRCVRRHKLTSTTTPDAIDWPNFQVSSATRMFTGTDQTLSIQLSTVTNSGSPVVSYRKNVGGNWVTFAPGTPASISVVAGDSLQFSVTGSGGSTITVRNVSAANAVIDTVTGTACNGTLIDGYCWTMSASGATCDTACSTRGGYNDGATQYYAGTEGTDANCKTVLNALGYAGNVAAPTFVYAAVGCSVRGATLYREVSSTTTGAGSYTGSLRACACGPSRADFSLASGLFSNFLNTSNLIPLDGINSKTELSVTATNQTGSPILLFSRNGGAWTNLTSGVTVPFFSARGDTLQFSVTGTVGHAATFVIRNVTEGNTTVATITGTVGTKVEWSTATTTTFTVPSGVTSLVVKGWGAGGGNGYIGSESSGGMGGGGGFAFTRNLAVTPGEVLNIVVGAGGATGPAGSTVPAVALGGGGRGSPGNVSGDSATPGGGGGGGGRVAILRGTTTIFTAAGGGGGAGGYKDGATSWHGGFAGAGGGTIGYRGGQPGFLCLSVPCAATGGTQTAGGTGAQNSNVTCSGSSPFQGGAGSVGVGGNAHQSWTKGGGGGGGGGYYGGGGGFCEGGAGAGGSSYFTGTGYTKEGKPYTPAEQDDLERGTAGFGGFPMTATPMPATSGKLIINY